MKSRILRHTMSEYSLSGYTYTLPDELIAQEAIHPHHDARMMVISRESGKIESESSFFHLPDIVDEKHVMFFNNSKVLPARIHLDHHTFVRHDGTTWVIEKGEILFCQKLPDNTFEALVRPGSKFKIGNTIHFPNGAVLEVVAVSETGRIFRMQNGEIESLMEQYGALPLPPYISYSKEKEKDYQTAFAEEKWSVAAPTASLHFTPELLSSLHCQTEYITLHVWLGTFKWIDVEDIREYRIHRETIDIDLGIFDRIAEYKLWKKRLIAVGTTVCRTLESLPSLWAELDLEKKNLFNENIRNYWDTLTVGLPQQDWIHDILYTSDNHCRFSTSIYITPGYIFSIVDELITNFHLPETSLLVLVSAFLGKDKTLHAYEHAISEKYRFFSFWDGMYIRSTALSFASEKNSI